MSMLGLIFFGAFWLFFVAAQIAAYLWGGRTEKFVAALLLLALALSVLLVPADSGFHDVETGILFIDLGVLVGCGWAAIRDPRGWLICATAFQIISTLAHLGRIVVPDLSPMAYGLMEGASGIPMLIALLGGVWARRFRTQKR